MSQLATRLRAPEVHRDEGAARPSSARLLRDQVGYAVRDLWRTRVAFIFTFLFPLIFLVLLGALAGNGTISADSPVRVTQFVTPSAAAMGALYGSYPTVAASLAEARERGILKRLHGTPLPGWVHLAGRLGAAAVFALGSLTLMVLEGVVVYDVQIQWRTLPATVVTVLVAVGAFAAVGVAVAGLARSATVAQAAAIATAVLVSFVSGVMSYGDLPTWVDRIAQFFPLKYFNDALQEQFDPFAAGGGWDLTALAVIVAWGVGAAAVAALTFRWSPVVPRGRRAASRPPEEAEPREPVAQAAPSALVSLSAAETGRRSEAVLLLDQAAWATRSALHDTGWVFFAITFPVVQYAFTAAVMGDAYSQIEIEPPFEVQSAAGMVAWGVMVTAMVFVPDAVSRSRDQGILKRLRGTPSRATTFFAGWLVSALLLVLVTAVLIVAIGSLWFGLRPTMAGLLLTGALLVLGTAVLIGCGMLIVAVLPNSKAVSAVGLGLAIPLAFCSDVFVIGVLPSWMSAVGDVFPLKHLANSLSLALDPGGPTVSWLALGVLTAWLLGAVLLAVRFFRWSVRS